MSVREHKAQAPSAVGCYVLTISDTRTEADDTSGDAIVQLLTAAGHELTGRALVKDDPGAVRTMVANAARTTQVVITTGGTGITSRDSTYEAITGLLDKRLDGFGELFRMLSFQEIGAAAMLSRACAGTCRGKIVVALPGSENAVRLALTRLLIPELRHLVSETRR